MAISTSIVLDPDADLAAALKRRGKDIILSRGSVSIGGVRALTRRYSPSELAQGSGLQQGDSLVIIAGSALDEWAVDETGDEKLPRLNDKTTISGIRRNVQSSAPFHDGDKRVRIEIQVRG